MPPKPFKPPGPIPTEPQETTSSSRRISGAVPAKRKASSKPASGRSRTSSTGKGKAVARAKKSAAVSDEDDEEGTENGSEEDVASDTSTRERSTLPSSRTAASQSAAHPRPRAAVEEEDDEDTREKIPPPLLTRLLHEFMGDGMRISKDGDKAVGVYVDIFVREAIARAKYMGVEEEGRDFLEVIRLALCHVLVDSSWISIALLTSLLFR